MSTLLVETGNHVATITLNRPEKLNALNRELLDELFERLVELDRPSEDIRCAVLTGAGEKAFAAGADIAAMAEMTPVDAKRFSDLGHRIGVLMEQARFPIIGAVNGFALGGGCELALACDFVYASDKAKFGQPEVNLAVIPGFGGTQRLARRVGAARARELCMTGDAIGADEALRIGLVNAVVPHAELKSRVEALAKKIAAKPPLAVALIKRVVLRGADIGLPSANELEAQAFSSLFGTRD